MSGERVGVNSMILLIAEAVRRVMAFVVIFLVGRALAVDDFGRFALAKSFMVIFVVIADFGLGPMLIRRVAEGKEDESVLLGNAQVLKAILSSAAILVIIGLTYALDYDPVSRWAIIIVALAIPAEVFSSTYVSRYDGKQRMELDGGFAVARTLALVALVGVSILFDWGLYGIVVAYTMHYVVGVLVAAFLSRHFLGPLRLSFSFQYIKGMAREAVPYLLIGVVWMVTFRVDMIMLSALMNETSVGYYNAAYSLFEVLLVLPILISRALFPALSATQAEGDDSELLRKSIRIFGIIALPVGVGMALTSRKALEFVFSDKFDPAAPTLSLLSLFLLIWFGTMSLSWALTARNQLKHVLRANMAALISNIVANFILIPKFDYMGAAIATLISETTYLCTLLPQVHKLILPAWKMRIHPGVFVSTALMAGAVWYVRDWPLVVMIAVGIVVYLVAGWITGALREAFVVSMMRKLIARIPTPGARHELD
ncbi:MAG: flippase [Deltaproteobacteria bacterium]|nr:flippase [bacterium]MCB9477026.1 flippase [Deltaproteobacteria bacterium]MCB9479648.1 flippase [Deltaproteobacteria bacterium]MCB9489855.1 flippase [Deltaproteobacteria bacterium]